MKKNGACRKIAIGLYLATLCIWLISGFFRGVKSGNFTKINEDITAFQLESISSRYDSYADYHSPLVSTDPDAQMIYPEVVSINGLSFKLRGHVPTGTPMLYYRKPGEERYQSVQPTEYRPEDGTYIFDCGVLDQVEIRIDPVSAAGCVFEITDFTWNLDKPFWRYLIPTLDQLILLLGIPAFLLAFIKECTFLWQPKNKTLNKE